MRYSDYLKQQTISRWGICNTSSRRKEGLALNYPDCPIFWRFKAKVCFYNTLWHFGPLDPLRPSLKGIKDGFFCLYNTPLKDCLRVSDPYQSNLRQALGLRTLCAKF